MYEGEIQLKPNHTPAWIPARPIPYNMRPIFEQHIQDLKTAGVIEECKKSLPDKFQMPLIGHVADRIGGCKIYSCFDLAQGFH